MNPLKARRPQWVEVRRSPGQQIALGVFALMAVLVPLLFGAVDRLPQIVLLVLLVIGIVAQPPAVVPLSRWGNRLAIALLALLLIKEFAPEFYENVDLEKLANTPVSPESAKARFAQLRAALGGV